ncbi:hypothetical protein GALMADRAFT_159440 [Galerina marginata CBS 339.88]|uniref:Uncharacterized protein n=1 Tax=Galerina marginata (strain CBS 339.88) TaxID=685588 RepID=A0A067SL48_GALM3|nr:hypothetical protein GALMADRAFT_159440 [Galerina marginata CBS 339.88]
MVVGAAHTCQYLACVCTNDHAYQLQTCVDCVVALTPYVDGIVDQYQSILDEWVNSYCAEFPTPPLHVTRPGAQTSSTPTPTPTPNSSSKLSPPWVSATSLYSLLMLPVVASLLAL